MAPRRKTLHSEEFSRALYYNQVGGQSGGSYQSEDLWLNSSGKITHPDLLLLLLFNLYLPRVLFQRAAFFFSTHTWKLPSTTSLICWYGGVGYKITMHAFWAIFSWKTFTVLHSDVHTKSGRSSCVKTFLSCPHLANRRVKWVWMLERRFHKVEEKLTERASTSERCEERMLL